MPDMPDARAQPVARYADLDGKTVFISGGATGIGRDLVLAFAAQNARVLFVDIDIGAGTELAAASAGRARFVPCDVTDNAALTGAIDQAEQMGGLDVLINNAANDLRQDTGDVTPEDWQSLFDVNLRHQFFASQRAAHHMGPRGRGAIVNLGSVAPQLKVPNLAVYSTCKSAVRGLTRSLARDFGPLGIRVNSIAPGAVLTEKQRKLWYPDQASIDRIVAQQCIARELSGQDIAHMALFLASDASAACTAQEFIVDGGIT